MPTEQELVIAAFFHATRSAKKKPRIPGTDKIVEAIRKRAEEESRRDD